MKARDIMRAFPQVGRPDDSLVMAREMMLWGEHRHLPVLDGNRLVGVLTDTDILAYQARVGESLASRSGDTVEMAMTRDPQTAYPDAPVVELAGRMAADHLDCLPVVEAGELLGIVTVTDVLLAQVREAMTPSEVPRVLDVMTPVPHTIHADDRLLDAAARMQQHRVRHLPVVDAERRVVGMLSDRDIRTAIGDPSSAFEGTGPGPRIAELHVNDVMSSPPITTRAQSSAADAARAFLDHTTGALPVVDDDDRLVGIVSYIDLLRVLAT